MSKGYSLSKPEPKPKPQPGLILLGEQGIGKSTFGAAAEDPIFICTERGIEGLDVMRLPNIGVCETWDELLHCVRTVLDGDHDRKWLVIDTINGAQHLAAQAVCDREFGGKWHASGRGGGYNQWGQGEKATAMLFRELINLLDAVKDKGMGVIMLSHVGLLKQANALGADFYKFAGQMEKRSWELLLAWSDQVGHACREMNTRGLDGESKAKSVARGSERWIIFEGSPGRDTKCRVGYDMPAKILLSWDEYAKHLGEDPVKGLVEQAIVLLAEATDETQSIVERRMEGDITRDSLNRLGKVKVESMINWLLSRQETQQDAPQV